MKTKGGKYQRIQGNVDLFESEDRLVKLKKQNNSLEIMSKYIDWAFFGKEIEKSLPKVDYSKGGRPPISRSLMFKVLVLQNMYNLSDEGIEYQILDRNSFMEFLNLKTFKDVPDAKTIWLVRDQLNKAGILDSLFIKFNQRLEQMGIILNKGGITDATIIETPKQRNTRDENRQIKEGNGEDLWNDNPEKKAQKDVDARWLKKDGENYFGYKDHIVVDERSKIIIDFEVTDASVHDSQIMPQFINNNPDLNRMYGDSAYSSKEIAQQLKKSGMTNKINEKGNRNNPLTAKQFESNRKKSKIRARVEHVFGMISKGMGGLKFYVKSLARITAKITLMNIVYNIKRVSYLLNFQGEAVSNWK